MPNSRLFLTIGFYVLWGASFAQSVETKASLDFQNGYWVLEIKAPNQLALQTMEAAYPEKNVAEMEVTAFHALYSNYLSHSFELRIDSVPIPMNLVGIELNSAKANGKFISTRFAEPAAEIWVQIESFREIEPRTTFLTIRVNDKPIKATLNLENAYQVNVSLID